MRRKSLPNSLLIGVAIALIFSGCQKFPSASTGKPSVDILYLNHGPVLAVLQQVDPVLAAYGDQIQVNRYDFDTQEGAAFAKKMGINQHMPLAIYINGSDTFDLNGRKITFESFPQGAGTAIMAAGSWTFADLDAALKQATGQ